MREIKSIMEIHTYKLHDDWMLDIQMEKYADGKYWAGYIYMGSGHKMFVIGQSVKKAPVKSGTGKNGSFTLDDFKKIMKITLYGEDSFINFFEKWEFEQNALDLAEETYYGIIQYD